jgi:hypothetical protein|eukprot:COSAG01_NODE_7471_length_3197_cov_6.716591_4_plen_83_part_00
MSRCACKFLGTATQYHRAERRRACGDRGSRRAQLATGPAAAGQGPADCCAGVTCRGSGDLPLDVSIDFLTEVAPHFNPNKRP